MDVKTESKILLTALAIAPTVGGILLIVTGEAVAFGVVALVIGFGVMILIWQPWKWFGKKK